MLITDAFLGEHAVFYLLVQDIEKAIPTLETVAALTNRAAPLSFSLEAHARLEDELLFTALEPHLGAQSGPLAVMRTEHDQIINLLGEIESETDLEQGRTLAAQMIEVSRSHFQKEEKVLFHMAQQFLGEEQLSALGAKWSQRRAPLIMI
ncbi:MAG: hemerythrin domain-containing protein [Chloroflexi bacterium]|nr:hemerythrin domain-containing protein [Chloroflexota bacterium]MBI3169656.1 hemerythrin domain-containing protein [Chloroflexota bacterium]